MKTFRKQSGNEVLDGEGFYISYARNPGGGFSMWAGDSGPETALVKPDAPRDQKFLILNGDFRKGYAELVDQGYEACKAFFLAHPDDMSSWSGQ